MTGCFISTCTPQEMETTTLPWNDTWFSKAYACVTPGFADICLEPMCVHLNDSWQLNYLSASYERILKDGDPTYVQFNLPLFKHRRQWANLHRDVILHWILNMKYIFTETGCWRKRWMDGCGGDIAGRFREFFAAGWIIKSARWMVKHWSETEIL